MTSIALSTKAVKLMKLCEAEGLTCLDDLLSAAMCDGVCPAICMTEGCDCTTEMEPDQTEGYCEACGGNTVVSALVLAGMTILVRFPTFDMPALLMTHRLEHALMYQRGGTGEPLSLVLRLGEMLV